MENYIGPYWSDGKWQESVEFGDANPMSQVDAASRLHDSAYAHYKDEKHRIAADQIYSETLKKLKEKYSGLADVPLYGNYTKNRVKEFGSNFAEGFKVGGLAGGLGSLVYTGVKGIVRLNDLITNGAKYRQEVLDYYDTDPKKIQTVTKTNKHIVPIVTPQPKAPKTIQTVDEMFTRKVAPQPTNEHLPAAPEPRARVSERRLYKPLTKKRRRPTTAADLELYLKYHPDDRKKVLEWINKHNKVFP